MAGSTRQFVLIIVDGLGLRDAVAGNAFKLASTPVFDRLFRTYPSSRLDTSGKAVGLPNGVMGNSEVGHLTIGAGRIVKQDLVRINEAIQDGTFGKIPAFKDVFSYVRRNGSSLHLMGLVSDGSVHSYMDHLFAILRAARKERVDRLFLHAVTDGRDTSPTSGLNHVRSTLEQMASVGLGRIATIVGRYYAMDRDKRWDRTEIAYRAYVAGEGKRFEDPISAVKSSYDDGISDEFITPKVIGEKEDPPAIIHEEDALLCFNFRSDRMRQIAAALGGNSFEGFDRILAPVFTTTFTRYDDDFTFPILFDPVAVANHFGAVLDARGLRQLRVAETEKYAHVTYFFNGGEETPYPHERRILVPSPKVATYDLEPQMSAYRVEEKVVEAISSGEYDCIIVNLANPDMVGHTGDLKAAIRAAEVVDEVVGNIVQDALDRDMVIFVTSDHGNCEMMMDDRTGQIHTAHTTNPIPFIAVSSDKKLKLRPRGSLADIAPTILDYLHILKPKEMTGKSLLFD